MGQTKTKFTAEIEIKALLTKAEQEMASFGKGLKSAWQGGEPPKGMLKAVEDLRARLESLRMVAAKGVVDYSDLRIAKGDYEAFTKTVRNLKIEFGLLTEEQKLAMLGKQEQENIKAREAAMTAYTKAVRKNAEEQRKYQEQLEKAQQSKAEKEQKVSTAKQRLSGISPQVQKQADEYAQSLKEISELDAKILEQEKLIDKYRKQGLSDSPKANNKLTQTIDAYAESMAAKQSKQAAIDADVVGKAAYDSIVPLREEIDKTNLEIADLDENIAKIENSSKEIGDKTTERFEELRNELTKLGVTSAKDAKSVEELRTAVSSLKTNALAGVDAKVKEISKELDTMGDVALSTGKEIDAAFESIDNQKAASAAQEQFTNRIKQFLGLSGAAQVLRSSLRNAMATITELDATMTEMAVVTDTNIGGYWDQLPEYTERANKLGLAIGDVYKADTLFYQQGLKTNEVVEISTETMKMAAIAGLDTATATDRMTAALRGFNMELNETSAQKVSDVYSELAAITAADVDEISSAMTKTASIASSAGMEFETTAAFLSQIIETTRESAETAGTAMKTIVARFQELKKAPEEIGEIDGEIVDANAIEGALRSVGVALRDSSGQFRELDDVFLELSGKWSGLDKNTQRYIATIAAGSRQQSRFIAMMSDYKRTQELVAAANTSAGASQKQFEKTTESLRFKINKLKNAWNEFTMGIMNSDLVKMGVDILTKFFEVVNKATGALDGIGGSLTKIISIIGIFKLGKQIFEKFMPTISGFFSKIEVEAGETGTRAGQKFWKNFEDAKNGGQPQASDKTKKKEEDQPKTLKQRVVDTAKNITGWSAFEEAGAIHKAKQQADWARSNIAEQGDIKKNNSLKLKANAEKIAKLSEQRDKKRAYGWNKDTKPSQAKGADKARAKTVELDKEIIELEKESAELKQQNLEADEKIAKSQEIVGEAGKDTWEAIGQGVAQAGQAISGAGIAMATFGGILSSMGLEEAGDLFAKIGSYATIAGQGVSLLGPMIVKLVGTLVAGGISASIAWIWVTAIAIAIVGLIALVAVGFNEMKKNSPEGKLKAAEESAKKAAEAADQAKEAFEGLSNALNGLEEQYKNLDNLTKGTKEWNEALQETNSSVLDLIKEFPELSEFVKQGEGGVLKIDTDSAEVQTILKQSEQTAMGAKNRQTIADMNVISARNGVSRDKISDTVTTSIIASTFDYAQKATSASNQVANLRAQNRSIQNKDFQKEMEDAVKAAEEARIQAAENSKAITEESIDEFAVMFSEGKFVNATDEQLNTFAEELKIGSGQLKNLIEAAKDEEAAIRAHGKAVTQERLQEQIMYDQMASSVVGLVDTLAMSQERINQMFNLVDGEAYKKVYEDIKGNLGKTNLVDGNSDGNQTSLADATGGVLTDDDWGSILAHAGFKNATMNANDGTIQYYDEEKKETVTKKVSEADIQEYVAQYYTEITLKNRSENIDEYVAGMASNIASIKGRGASTVFEQALQDDSGNKLTENQNLELQKMLNDGIIQEAFDKLPEDLKKVYGSADDLKRNLQAAQEEAANAFANVNKDLEKIGVRKDNKDPFMNLTKEIKESLTKQLVEVSKFKNGDENVAKVVESYEELLSKQKDVTKQQEVSRLIANTDWSNQEKLLALQIDLENQYGYTNEEAEKFTQTLSDAAYATSSLATTIQAYDKAWRALEKVSQSTERLADLQWKYNEALESGGDNLEELINKQVEELTGQANSYKEAYDASLDNLAKAYAQGGTNYSVDLREAVTLGNYGVEVDSTRLAEYVASGKISQDEADNYISQLNEQYKASSDALSGMRDSLESIKELQEQSEQAYDDLWNSAKEAIIGTLQKQLDLQSQTLDATKEANSQLISKIQEQIDKTRQDRENQKTVDNINDLRNQQAYLNMSTVGGGLESLELQDQIAQAEQDYQDTLIDQSLQSLQDANAKAEEQRERQIALAESQLDIYSQSKELEERINNELAEMLAADTNWRNTGLGTVMASYYTDTMTTTEKVNWGKEISSQIGLAGYFGGEGAKNFDSATTGIAGVINNTTAAINQLSENVTQTSSNYKTQNQKTQLLSKGFDESVINHVDEKGLNNLTKISNSEDSQAIEELLKQLEPYAGLTGMTPRTMAEYYSINGIEIAEGSAGSYTDYLRSMVTNRIPWAENRMKEQLEQVEQEVGNKFDDYFNNEKTKATTQEEWVQLNEETLQQFGGALQNIYNRNKKYGLTKDNYLPMIAKATDSVVLRDYFEKMLTFKTGGLADFTGPAWLDGTPSKPEYILNSAQTERFFSLIDVLEHYKEDNKSSKPSGDNYFDINIQVEKLENDYDVEQVADKIRRMIYEDASYRNVNAINLIR